MKKKTVASARTSLSEKAAPPACAVKPDNAGPLFKLLAFKLLIQCWSSEQVSVSE